MSRYKIKFVPQGAIPTDPELGIHLKPEVEPGGVAASPCASGDCAGLDTPDGTDIAGSGSTTLRVVPVGLIPPESPCISDDDFSWVVAQVSGSARNVQYGPLGGSWQDGISVTWDSSIDGDYDGTSYVAYLGIAIMGTLALPCGSVVFNGPPAAMNLIIQTWPTFPYATYDDGTHVANYGVEPDLSFTGTWILTGTYTGPVVWTVTPTSGDPLYSYTILSSDDSQITIQFDQIGGADHDIIFLFATDALSANSPTYNVTQ